MSLITAVRRILLTNLNVIAAINYETGDDQILASKISGLTTAGTTNTTVPAVGYTATNVQAAIGFQVTFDSAYGTALLTDGDYMTIIEAAVGTLKVGTTVTKYPTGILVKPDMDGATVRVAIIPLSVG